MTKNSPKFFELVHTSVTFFLTISHQSQEMFFLWKFDLELLKIGPKNSCFPEPSFLLHITLNFMVILIVAPSIGRNKVKKLATFRTVEFHLKYEIRLTNN